MDYQKIIINGILDENTKSHLDLYFYRQYENAKEKKYSLIEFFSGLNKGIEELTTLAINKREKEKKNLLNDIEFAKTRHYNTKEEVEREIQWQNTKAENLLNSSPSIDIENENFKAKINVKALESVLFFIKIAFDKAKNSEGAPMPPHHVFTTEKGEQIFKEWHELHKDKKSHSDYSFIFRVLERDGFLLSNVGESVFRNYLENYDVILGKLKTFNSCTTTKKESLYSQIKMSKKQ